MAEIDRPALTPAPEPDGETYLKLLGERVRAARTRRGMTRKILSRDSGVSERYLAQLETGEGNVSILRLREIAAAMSLPLAELVREGAEPPVELTLLQEQLGRLEPAELAEVQASLRQRFGDTGDRSGRIALIGLRGAGKSALGRGLAARLGAPFVQLDREVEQEAGMSLREIFDLLGQAAYRRLERRCLERIVGRHDQAVIETSGGLVSEPGTFERLLSTCYTIWLRARPDEHMARVVAQGDHRPMAGNREAMADLRRILEERDALYRKADATLDTSGRTPEQSLDELEAFSRRARGG